MQSDAPPPSRPRLLLFEPVRAVQGPLRGALEDAGYEVAVVSDARELAGVLPSFTPDLSIVDLVRRDHPRELEAYSAKLGTVVLVGEPAQEATEEGRRSLRPSQVFRRSRGIDELITLVDELAPRGRG